MQYAITWTHLKIIEVVISTIFIWKHMLQLKATPIGVIELAL